MTTWTETVERAASPWLTWHEVNAIKERLDQDARLKWWTIAEVLQVHPGEWAVRLRRLGNGPERYFTVQTWAAWGRFMEKEALK